MTTLEKVIAHWETIHTVKYDVNRQKWNGHDPRNPGSDSDSFALWDGDEGDGEGGGWNYIAHGEKGTLYDLAVALGIEVTPKSKNRNTPSPDLTRVPTDNPPGKGTQSKQTRLNSPVAAKQVATQPKPSKEACADMRAYCDRKGYPLWYAEKCGWKQITFASVPAIEMEHIDNGVKRRPRIRKLSKGGDFQPVGSFEDWCKANGVEWSEKYQKDHYRCLYKFDEAVAMAIERKQPIVLTNGQPGVIKAQYHAIAAFAQTDGEVGGLQADLLKRVVDAVHKHDLLLIIALDADNPGRDQAATYKSQFAAYGIDAPVVDFGGHNGYDLDDFCSLYKSETMKHIIRLCSYRTGDLKPVVDSLQMADDFSDFISYREEDSALSIAGTGGEIVPMPIPEIARMGGNARMLLPGMLSAIIAPSGGGKTSMIELIIDELMKLYGMDCLLYTPEWTDDKLHHRRIHRNGNGKIKWSDLQAHAAWINEVSRNVPDAHRIGVQLNQSQRMEATNINQKLYGWSGRLHTFQGKKFTEYILDDMINRLSVLRRNNRRVGLAVFDYIQLMRTNDEQNSRSLYETMLAKIKQFSLDYGIHCLVGVQIEKSKATKKILDIYDAQWVRPDYFNLIILPNLMREPLKGYGAEEGDEEPTYQTVAVPGSNREHIKALVNVGKNSGGKKGVVRMMTDFERLTWMTGGTWSQGDNTDEKIRRGRVARICRGL